MRGGLHSGTILALIAIARSAAAQEYWEWKPIEPAAVQSGERLPAAAAQSEQWVPLKSKVAEIGSSPYVGTAGAENQAESADKTQPVAFQPTQDGAEDLLSPPPAEDEPPPAPAPTPPRPSAPPTDVRPPLPPRGRLRLARAPNMFGDFYFGSTEVDFGFQQNEFVAATEEELLLITQGQHDLPLGGGATRMNPAENNSALPQQRLFFMHNYYHGSADGIGNDGTITTPNLFGQVSVLNTSGRSQSFDRYTIGMEHLLKNDGASIGLRMPFTSRFEYEEDPFAARTGVRGNLNVFVKSLVYRSESTAIATGLGFDLPTGSDAEGRIFQTTYRIENEAVHVQPFLGVLATPTEVWFVHGFLSGDFALSDNPIIVDGPLGPSGRIGSLENQNLLHVDMGGGLWFVHNPHARTVTGVAGILELHYTTTLDDANAVTANLMRTMPPLTERLTLTFGNLNGRVDVLNLTAGVHIALGDNVTLRFGAVTPLVQEDSQFDVELQSSLNIFAR